MPACNACWISKYLAELQKGIYVFSANPNPNSCCLGILAHPLKHIIFF